MNSVSIQRLLVVCMFFIVGGCQAQSEDKSYKDLKAYYEKRVKKFLLKDKSIRQSFTISDSGIVLYRLVKENPGQKQTTTKKEVEYYLPWQQLAHFQQWVTTHPHKTYEYYQQQKLPSKPEKSSNLQAFTLNKDKHQLLKGLKVALDPGHIAGDLATAKKERKFIHLTLANGQKISFFESELAWYTCKVLAQLLENKGAQVILTRNQFHLMALDSTYHAVFKNYQQQQKKLGKTIRDSQKWWLFFKKFRKQDFKARAQKINSFRPHLTMVVHYNVDGANAPWTSTTPHNNCMAFVPGSFMKNELSDPEQRFNFLRLLLTQEIENSTKFSARVLASIAQNLKVPVLPFKNNQPFIERFCMKTPEPGVYARNLSLARMVYGTLCYIEPLYQDNDQEILKLSKREVDFQGKKIPQRVVEVAKTYYTGIVNYLQK